MEKAAAGARLRPKPKPNWNWIGYKAALWLFCLWPISWLTWAAFHNQIGPNPVEFITHFTGSWTIQLLLATLAITPLRKLLKRPQLIRLRRPLGLFAFFYGCLHFLTWFWLDKTFDVSEMLKDVVKRPFITAGFLGFVAMIPLAVTSTSGWIRRMGGKNWQRLHRLIYLTAIAGVVHYYWLVKSDVTGPLTYGAILAVLLIARKFV